MELTPEGPRCQICEAPGKTTHFPGPVPYTGSWCDYHYEALRTASQELEELTQKLAREVSSVGGEIGNYTWIAMVQTDSGWQEKSTYGERCWAIGNTASAIVKSGVPHTLRLRKVEK